MAYFPSADDLCFINYVREMGVFDTMEFLQDKVTFRWTGFLLMCVLIKIHLMGVSMKILMMLMHLTFILMIYVALRNKLKVLHHKLESFNLSILIYFVLFFFVPFSNELFFWLNSLFIYLLPIVFSIFYFSLSNTTSKYLFLMRALAAIVIGGCAEASSFVFMSLFILEIILLFYFGKKEKWQTLVLFILFVLSIFYNLSGDGIEKRLIMEANKINDVANVSANNILNFKEYFMRMFSLKQVLGILLIIVLQYELRNAKLINEFKSLKFYHLMGIGFGLIAVFAIYFKVKLGDFGPPRLYSMAFALIAFAIILIKWPEVISEKFVAVGLIVILILMANYMVPKIISTNKFKMKMNERLALISEWSRRGEKRDLILKPIPMPPFLIYTELSNDPEAVENQYLKAYLNLQFEVKAEE